MDHKKPITLVRSLVILAVLAVLLFAPKAVLANVRIENGGQVPFYARLDRESIYTDGSWVAIVFYRPLDCIPETFNLLNFFDFANAWGKATTTEGFDIWKNGPKVDMAPIQSELHGKGAVPVWFVSHPDMQSAIIDGQLTIGELASLPSLMIGSASFYHETLHPHEAASKGHLTYEAHGTLADGTAFKVHVSSTEAKINVRIRFTQ